MDNKELFLKILYCDSSADVIKILKEFNLWDDLSNWRPYGDNDNNASSAMNQQSTAERSLLEKITNNIDSVLTAICMEHGIDPSSKDAPQSMKEAVAKFFSQKENYNIDIDGSISNWDTKQVTEVSKKYIQLFATGKGHRSNSGYPCINLFDLGEGQTPRDFSNTFLSLGKNNKQNIHFVQGRFNMGGSGILRFCEHHLQLIVSKRNPKILENFSSDDPRKEEWGFTVTRFEFEEGRKNPTLFYLAPKNSSQSPRRGEVLSFNASTLKLKAVTNQAYSEDVSYGTLMKFYEFKSKRRSNVLFNGELQDLIEKNMPEASLPIRIHECRKEFKGKAESSFVNNIVGLQNRILINKGDVLEDVSPYSQDIKIDDNIFTINFFAFKKGQYNHLKDEGIIFSMNGQFHGGKRASFFTRKKVNLGYIAHSLLVIVDCSKIKQSTFFDLFMGNRETTVATELMNEIENTLEDVISNHDGYRRLRQSRLEEDQKEQIRDDKSLEKIMEDLLKQDKVLSNIFGLGERLSSAFNRSVKLTPKSDFKLEQHPTFFKHFKIDKKIFNTSTPINKKKLFKFSSNVVNDYFDRNRYKGKFDVYIRKDDKLKKYESKVGVSLSEGLIKYNLDIPENAIVGEKYDFEFHLYDSAELQGMPFILKSRLKITSKVEPKKNRNGGKRYPNKTNPLRISDEKGNDREIKKGLDLPNLIWQGTDKYNEREWDDDSVLDIQQGNNENEFLWFINVNNFCLEQEVKQFASDTSKLIAIKEKFRISMALIGISIKHIIKKKKLYIDDFTKEREAIRNCSKFIAPVMMTLVDKISSIDIDSLQKVQETED